MANFGWYGDHHHLGHLSNMLQQLRTVIIQPHAGIMQMYPGGPDVGLGVGSKPRHERFIKYSDDNEYMRWANLAEQFVAFYRAVPGTIFDPATVENWMQMNGFKATDLPNLAIGLMEHGVIIKDTAT